MTPSWHGHGLVPLVGYKVVRAFTYADSNIDRSNWTKRNKYRLKNRPFKLDKEKQQTFTKHIATKVSKMKSKNKRYFFVELFKIVELLKIDFEPEDVTERGCEEEEGKGMEGQRFLKPTMPVDSLSYQGSISPTHWCKAQMLRHSTFGTKRSRSGSPTKLCPTLLVPRT